MTYTQLLAVVEDMLTKVARIRLKIGDVRTERFDISVSWVFL